MRRGGNVITSHARIPDFTQGDRHAVSRTSLPRLRRRQPHVRAAGSADQVPPGQPQERHRLRAGARSHQDRGARPHQRLHPQPDVRGGRPPGAQEDYFRNGAQGKSYREILGEPMKAIPAFREPAARLEVMDELGIDYALMFPTLASLVEERMKDDPEMTHDVIHALNEWMYEQWTFNYQDRIFATPVITLPIVDRALEELEWCLERGARTVLVRPAPVPGFKGSRSFGLEEFDPFWQACVKAEHPGLDARLGQRLLRVRATCGSPATSSCRSSRPPSAASRWAIGRSWTRWVRWCATARCRATRSCGSCRSRTAPTGCRTCSRASRASTRRCRRRSARTRSRRSSAASTSPRSGRTASPRSSTWWAPTGCSSAPTGRTPRA